MWTAPEEPLPMEAGDLSFALPRLGWIVSGTREDGIVRMVQHGGDHTSPDRLSVDVPGYARHAYATHACARLRGSGPVDSHIALITADGRVSHRSPALPLTVEEGRAVSRHRAHWWQRAGPIPNDVHRQDEDDRSEAGPWLTTASLHGPWEVRLARVDRGTPRQLDRARDLGEPWPQSAGPWKLRFGGWALALDESSGRRWPAAPPGRSGPTG